MSTAARMSLSQVVERLTEKRTGFTSVTIKMSAQGVVMPEVTVAAGADDTEVDTCVEQAVRAFTTALAAALPDESKKGGAK